VSTGAHTFCTKGLGLCTRIRSCIACRLGQNPARHSTLRHSAGKPRRCRAARKAGSRCLSRRAEPRMRTDRKKRMRPRSPPPIDETWHPPVGCINLIPHAYRRGHAIWFKESRQAFGAKGSDGPASQMWEERQRQQSGRDQSRKQPGRPHGPLVRHRNFHMLRCLNTTRCVGFPT
jgi:hypothetical protein